MVDDIKIQTRLAEIEEAFKKIQMSREELGKQINSLQAQDQELVRQSFELRGEFQGLQKLITPPQIIVPEVSK